MSSSSETWKSFEKNPLTHSAAHYLMTIRALRSEQGYARLTDIAKELNISPGSCSLSLKALRKKELIEEDSNKFFFLSEKGKKLTDLVEQNEELLTFLFEKVLGMSKKQSKIDACKMEHLLSEEGSVQLQRLKSLIESDSPEAKNFLNAFNKQ